MSFLYGVFHAAGPGHGKAVITSYVLASGDTVRRGIVISFAAAMVQAVSAIVIVLAATVVIGATAAQITGVTDWLEIGSYGAIVAGRAVAGVVEDLRRRPSPPPSSSARPRSRTMTKTTAPATTMAIDAWHHHHHDHHGHDHHGLHDHHGDDGDVRVAHDLDALAAARKVQPVVAAPMPAAVAPAAAAAPGGNWLWRAWSAILAVGIRPCSGAIIILVFALSQGLLVAGIAATFVMALGTGLTVAALATIAVSAKGLATRFAGDGHGHGGTLLRAIEIGGALAVLLFGILLLGGALYPML